MREPLERSTPIIEAYKSEIEYLEKTLEQQQNNESTIADLGEWEKQRAEFGKLKSELMLKYGKDENRIADLYGYSDGDPLNINEIEELDALVKMFIENFEDMTYEQGKRMEELQRKLSQNRGPNGGMTADELVSLYELRRKQLMGEAELTERENENIGELIQEFEMLQKPYEAIIKLRKEEADAIAKQRAEEEKAVKERQAREDAKTNKASELFDRYYRDTPYDKANDRLRKVNEEVKQAGLSEGERDQILSIEVGKMLQEAMSAAITKTTETISSGGIRSLKDFQFESVTIDEKRLKAVEDINKAAQDMTKYLETMAAKLPSPTMAQ